MDAKTMNESSRKLTRAGLPAGMKIVADVEIGLEPKEIRLIMEGWEVKRLIDDAKARLDAINARLLEAHGPGCALVVTGLCRASLAERQTVKVSGHERLEKVLGARYADLVAERVNYTAEPRLIELATDGDDPLQPAIAACLTIGGGQTVTWRAEK